VLPVHGGRDVPVLLPGAPVHRQHHGAVALALALAAVAGCGNNGGKPIDAAVHADAEAADAAPVDAAPIDGKPADAGPDAKPGFTLHLVNDVNWCDVTVNGTKFVMSAPPDKIYDPGTVVNLFAAPTSGTFEWGYWTGTDAQRDGGLKDTDQTATVTMDKNQNVTVCCPFSSTHAGC
jgi:hypothetical protein